MFNGYLVGPDANLSEAILTGIDLTGADLKGADLTGANLINANLTGADLTGTDLTGVISYSVVGTPILLKGGRYSTDTWWAYFSKEATPTRENLPNVEMILLYLFTLRLFISF